MLSVLLLSFKTQDVASLQLRNDYLIFSLVFLSNSLLRHLVPVSTFCGIVLSIVIPR